MTIIDSSFILENIRRFNNNVKNLGGGYIRFWASEIYCFIRFGCSPDDYFRYEFFRKSNYERNKFITFRRSKKIIRENNNPEYAHVFNDKREFNSVFHGFIGRAWIDLSTSSNNEFEIFVRRYKQVLMKPVGGSQGRGIFLLTEENLPKLRLEDYRNYVAEEIVQQHSSMADLGGSSVNTIRVLTFGDEIVSCALKVGGEGVIVDNFNTRTKGLLFHLDRQYGVIDLPGVDIDLNRMIIHPQTKKLIVGFQIPNWDKVLALVKSATSVTPEVRYIGWDVAVRENDAVIIEGNYDPGHDVVQMNSQIGLYSEIKELNKRK